MIIPQRAFLTLSDVLAYVAWFDDPIVIVDADATLLWPHERIRAALAALALPEIDDVLIDPSAVLPGFHPGSWLAFLTRHNLVHWKPAGWPTIYRDYRSRLWSGSAWLDDRLTPGSREALRTIQRQGGRVHLLTGRPERMRSGTVACLDRHGLADIPVHIADRCRRDCRACTCIPAGKAATARREIDTTGRRVAVVIDDCTSNLEALLAAYPSALGVHCTLPRLTATTSGRHQTMADFRFTTGGETAASVLVGGELT